MIAAAKRHILTPARLLASEAKGHKFESCRAHHTTQENTNKSNNLIAAASDVADCQNQQKVTKLGQNSDNAHSEPASKKARRATKGPTRLL